MVMVNVLTEKMLIFVSQDAKQQKFLDELQELHKSFSIDINPRGLKAKGSPV